jgi:hypothetical protein
MSMEFRVIGHEDMNYIYPAKGSVKWRAFVNIVMHLMITWY